MRTVSEGLWRVNGISSRCRVQGEKLFLYPVETDDGAEKDPANGPWTAQEIAEAWGKITR